MPATWAGGPNLFLNFRRAAGFFDVVCYTGNGSPSQIIPHNLGAKPSLIIIKRVNGSSNWFVGLSNRVNNVRYLNSSGTGNSISWTSWGFNETTFATPSISGSADVSVSGGAYVAYLS